MDLVKGGAIFGVIIGLWQNIKAVIEKLVSILVKKAFIKSVETHEAVISYLIKEYSYSQFYTIEYGSKNEQFRNGDYRIVSFELFGGETLIFKSNKRIARLLRFPFVFAASTDTNNDKENSSNSEGNTLSTIYAIRGTIDFDTIIRDATELWNKNTQVAENELIETYRFEIHHIPKRTDEMKGPVFSKSNICYAWYRQTKFRLLNANANEIGKQLPFKKDALEQLFFPQEVKDLINEIRYWKTNKKWFNEKGIPWKRGWLLHGKPGTGKTALVRAFAVELNMPIYVYSLSQLDNSTFSTAWKNMHFDSPCIALIEDIDNIFDGRINVSQRNLLGNIFQNKDNNEKDNIQMPLTFDCLLNCIDGVDKSDGIFTIITTNDISKIDEALGGLINTTSNYNYSATRPGRIDRTIELGYMTNECKEQLAKHMLSEWPEQLLRVLSGIPERGDETPAQFQEYCSQIAIKNFWKNKNANNEVHAIWQYN